MNRIKFLFETKETNILSVYFTAGFPKLNDTLSIAECLENNGVDLIEIGIPFSDPLADGVVIQHSSTVALKNGMSLEVLFKQLTDLRKKVSIPVILMGYFNTVLQFGVEKFCIEASKVGVDGIILPDLPVNEYKRLYKKIFDKYKLLNIFLITPQTNEKRINEVDNLSDGFLYLVSSATTTGTRNSFLPEQLDYFKRINSLKLRNKKLIGFGISNAQMFKNACEYANGSIIGSAFINSIKNSVNLKKDIQEFCFNFKN